MSQLCRQQLSLGAALLDLVQKGPALAGDGGVDHSLQLTQPLRFLVLQLDGEKNVKKISIKKKRKGSADIKEVATH